jgi:hypothetical protein
MESQQEQNVRSTNLRRADVENNRGSDVGEIKVESGTKRVYYSIADLVVRYFRSVRHLRVVLKANIAKDK